MTPRTHDLSLGELTSQLDGLRTLVDAREKATTALLREQDRRYALNFRAARAHTKSGLAALKELTTQAFASSREAIQKAEKGQDSYNSTHNDLTRKMDKQYSDTLPRAEAAAEFHRVDEKIEELKREITGLRESRSEGSGRFQQEGTGRAQMNWTIGLVVLGLLQAASVVFSIVTHVR